MGGEDWVGSADRGKKWNGTCISSQGTQLSKALDGMNISSDQDEDRIEHQVPLGYRMNDPWSLLQKLTIKVGRGLGGEL